jgi:hypothetical protein
MKKYKRALESALLLRSSHADLAVVDQKPQLPGFPFGGSGIGEEQYQLRSQTINFLFDDEPSVRISKPLLNDCFAHVAQGRIVHACYRANSLETSFAESTPNRTFF